MKKIIALLCLVVLSSCGKDDPTASKDLFSSWANDDGSEVIDMTGGTFGSGYTFAFSLTTGERCSCSLAIGGTQASATAVLTGCAYVSGGGGNPGCASLNRAYTMTNAAAKLTICGAVCDHYH